MFSFCLFAMADGGVVGVLKKIGGYIDRSAKSGIDSTYIIVPKEPWQVMLKTNVNQTTYYLNSHMTNEPGEEEYDMNWKPQLTTGVRVSSGFWVGYRGYGLGYQKSIGKHDDINFMFSTCGSKYGFRVHLRHYDTSKILMDLSANFPNVEDPKYRHIEEEMDWELESPITVRTFLFEGYYLFNGKHYSNTAVFDQSTQQIKSAGSVMLGFTWFRSALEYANNKSFDFINFMNNVGRSKQWQYSMGVGYAYNWVPQRNWLLSIQAMPMLALINGIRSWTYKMEFPDIETLDENDDYYPTLIPDKKETRRSKLMPSGMARVGVVYNNKRFFVNVMGQFNTYGYKNGENSVRLVDWFVNTSLGYRF